MRPRLAITLGDPRGIGPEVVLQALASPVPHCDLIVVGAAAQLVALEPHATCAIDVDAQLTSSGDPRSLDRASAGRVAAAAVERATRMALAGEVDGVVTAPLEKLALHEAGYQYPGHTEWLAELAGGVDVAMMLIADALRVVLITTHIPLRQVPERVTEDLVVRVGRITATALEELWSIADPRLAVCAMNPHAGEGGAFGDEDSRILAPAAQALGATGPVPADTVFVRALRGEFDAVLTPSHDVGMTAVKVAGFGRGVNVTLGLPFIRTAPDHGTAFDLVGTGRADAGSMRAAIELAATLAARKRL